jgi:hypothetical protein
MDIPIRKIIMPTNIKTEKIFVRLPPERLQEVKAMAKEVGLPYTSFGGLLLWMGYRAYLRQVNPEKLFSVDQLVEMAKIAEQDNEKGEETAL